MFITINNPQTDAATAIKTVAAICVQDVDVQGVLQFTLSIAASCALHRHTSRVIHRPELCTAYFYFFLFTKVKVEKKKKKNILLFLYTQHIIAS